MHAGVHHTVPAYSTSLSTAPQSQVSMKLSVVYLSNNYIMVYNYLVEISGVSIFYKFDVMYEGVSIPNHVTKSS